MILNYFPDSYVELSKEVGNHPELCALLAKHPVQEFEVRLAEIATYCEVILDGDYSLKDLDKLCHILWKKLRAKDSSIILLN